MNSTIFIPSKIKVGYQERKDTYTGKLAYIIYWDQKGKLRKETSWESWRDNKIEANDYDNIPTEGFILNKKVGDYVSDWNHRQAYVRIYDSRNFEFEITVPNLLYILENTNSIKGKGLEGTFVYGWDGTELLLIPTSSPDYINLNTYSDMLTNPEKITGKDLVLGGTYRTNKNQDWIYLGRFDYWHSWSKINKGKKYLFQDGKGYEQVSSLSTKIVKCISKEPVSNYAELIEELQHKSIFSPIDTSKDEYAVYSQEELQEKIDSTKYYSNCFVIYNDTINEVSIRDNKVSAHYYGYGYGYYSGSRDSNYTSIKKEFCEVINKDQNDGLSILQLHEKYQFRKLNQYLVNGMLYHG